MGGKIYTKTEDPRARLVAFWSSNIGQALLKQEQQVIDDILPGLFGYHLVQLSIVPNLWLVQKSPIQCKVKVHALHTDLETNTHKRALRALPTALPIATESVDVMILHHTLDLNNHPHAVLREAVRTLIPEGHLIIVGFNQMSLWGINRPWKRWTSEHIHSTTVAARRLIDWLTLLDCSVDQSQYCFYRPAINQTGVMKKLQFIEGLGQRSGWPLGAAYIMVATKHLGGVRLIKPRWWLKERELMGVSVSRPPFRDLHRSGRPD